MFGRRPSFTKPNQGASGVLQIAARAAPQDPTTIINIPTPTNNFSEGKSVSITGFILIGTLKKKIYQCFKVRFFPEITRLAWNYFFLELIQTHCFMTDATLKIKTSKLLWIIVDCTWRVLSRLKFGYVIQKQPVKAVNKKHINKMRSKCVPYFVILKRYFKVVKKSITLWTPQTDLKILNFVIISKFSM